MRTPAPYEPRRQSRESESNVHCQLPDAIASSVQEERHDVAGGASPRKDHENKSEAPEGRHGQFAWLLMSPLRGFVALMKRCPGACAPGYIMPPLRGYSRRTRSPLRGDTGLTRSPLRGYLTLGLLLVITLAGVTTAQRWRRGRMPDPSNVNDRNGIPTWELDKEFKHDVFTFVRVKYTSFTDRGDWGKWRTDYLDADVNFSYRLQELTSLEVDPNGKVLELTDPELMSYPWIYIIEPGHMTLMDEEVFALRKYLLNGGFLMVDDFWGEDEWDQFYSQIKRVFRDREPEELPLEHEIFHCVYDLKEKPIIPSIGHAMAGQRTERWDANEAHYKGIFDDKGRMMAIICHNTDLGDGWEREGEDPWYFEKYSEKFAYPLGINIVVYAMTH